MGSVSTGSKTTPLGKWPTPSLPVASEIQVGFKACLYFFQNSDLFGCYHNDQKLKPF